MLLPNVPLSEQPQSSFHTVFSYKWACFKKCNCWKMKFYTYFSYLLFNTFKKIVSCAEGANFLNLHCCSQTFSSILRNCGVRVAVSQLPSWSLFKNRSCFHLK
jgi:hypothetical protein